MSKISEFNNLQAPSESAVLPIVDNAETRKITIANLRKTLFVPATSTDFGAVKVGDNLSIDANGVLSADSPTLQADWTATTGPGVILNKPTLSAVATSNAYNDLTGRPNIPPAQIQADWDQTDDQQRDYIKNKPTIPTVDPVNFSSVAANIVPSTDLQYNLGSPEKKWHSLYVGTGSIYVGDAVLSLENGKLTSSVGFSGSLTTGAATNGITGMAFGYSPVQTDYFTNTPNYSGVTSFTLTDDIVPGATSFALNYSPQGSATTRVTQGFSVTGRTVTLDNPLPTLLNGTTPYIEAIYPGPYTFPPGLYGPYTYTTLESSETGDFNPHTPATFSYTLDQNNYIETITITDPGSGYLLEGQDNRYITFEPTDYTLEPIRIVDIGIANIQGISTWSPGTYTASETIGGQLVTVTYTVSVQDSQYVNRNVVINSFTQSDLLNAGTSPGSYYISKNDPTVIKFVQTYSDDVNFFWSTQLSTVPSFGYAVSAVSAEKVFTGDYTDLTNLPHIPTDVSQLDDASGLLTRDITALTNNGNSVTLEPTGDLTLPAGGTIKTSTGLVATYFADAEPTSSVGQTGDMPGMVYATPLFVYICYATYDGVSNIWAKSATVGDTW